MAKSKRSCENVNCEVEAVRLLLLWFFNVINESLFSNTYNTEKERSILFYLVLSHLCLTYKVNITNLPIIESINIFDWKDRTFYHYLITDANMRVIFVLVQTLSRIHFQYNTYLKEIEILSLLITDKNLSLVLKMIVITKLLLCDE